jgi:hypothetical protein
MGLPGKAYTRLPANRLQIGKRLVETCPDRLVVWLSRVV